MVFRARIRCARYGRRGVALAFTMPTHTRINAVEFSREACSLLDRFDRTESGDLLVLPSKGQQEALFALEHVSEDVTAPILRLEHGLHNFSAFIVMPLFAFANAGVRIGGPREHAWVTAGALLAACYWQTDRHTVAAFGAVKSGIAKLPPRCGMGISAWERSVLRCRCLSLCLRSMKRGHLMQRSQAFWLGHFWPGLQALLF